MTEPSFQTKDCNEIKIYGSGKPVRLFAAGLHGREWEDTTEILRKLNSPKIGTLVLIPLVSKGVYISTLDPSYYPGLGNKILKVIEKFKPEIYIELHSYSGENFEKLTGKTRLLRIGVPAYSVLEAGVLLGSVSPYIRRKYFPKEALCLSFEIEKGRVESRAFVARMLDVIKETESRDGFFEYLKKKFPEQTKKAVEDYKLFYGEI
jgi:hypothetical protein